MMIGVKKLNLDYVYTWRMNKIFYMRQKNINISKDLSIRTVLEENEIEKIKKIDDINISSSWSISFFKTFMYLFLLVLSFYCAELITSLSYINLVLIMMFYGIAFHKFSILLRIKIFAKF